MYGVSPHPAQAPENSISGCLNWLPFTVLTFIKSPFGATFLVSTANAQFSTSFSWVSNGSITNAFSLAGQTSAQFPHPVQSIVLTCILYFNPFTSLPLASTATNASGAAANSSSVTRTGLIHACGQTNEHLLHCIQFSGFHSGTLTAIPRFSYAAVPHGNVPSSYPRNVDTGRSLPFWATIGLNISFMNAGSSTSGFSASTASAQEAGTSTFTNESIPASTAL